MISERFSYEVDQVEEENWTQLLLRFRDATIYQTVPYGTIRWERRNLSHIVIKRDGEVVAAGQLCLKMVPHLNRGVAYLPWGPMWRLKNEREELDVFQQTLRLLLHEYAGKRHLFVRIAPNVFSDDYPSIKVLLEEEGFRVYSYKQAQNTALIDLTPSLDDLMMDLKKKWRENLRRSQRKDIKLIEGVDDELWEVFTKLYKEMHERKQFTKTVSVEQFRQVQKRLPKELKMSVMIAYSNSEAVAGLIWSRIGDTSLPIFSATSVIGRTLGAAYLLRWNMLEKSKLLGCQYMDQGGLSAENNPGGYTFKIGMGGGEKKYVGSYYACSSLLSYFIIKMGERLRSIRG